MLTLVVCTEICLASAPLPDHCFDLWVTLKRHLDSVDNVTGRRRCLSEPSWFPDWFSIPPQAEDEKLVLDKDLGAQGTDGTHNYTEWAGRTTPEPYSNLGDGSGALNVKPACAY